MSGTPTRTEIEQYLIEQRAPRRWAEFLDGLPWLYLRPVVTIAKSSKAHPAVALAMAASYSSDQAFKAVAARHIERKDRQPDAPHKGDKLDEG